MSSISVKSIQNKPAEDLVPFGVQENEQPPMKNEDYSQDVQIKTEQIPDLSNIVSEKKETEIFPDQGTNDPPQKMSISPADFTLQNKSEEGSFTNSQRCSKFLFKIPDGFENEIQEMQKKREQAWREDFQSRVKADEVESLVKSKREVVETLEGIVDYIYENDPEGKMINQMIRENKQWYERALKSDNGYLESLTEAVAKIIEGKILHEVREETKGLSELNDQEIAEEVTSIMSGLFLYYIWHKNFLKECKRCDIFIEKF